MHKYFATSETMLEHAFIVLGILILLLVFFLLFCKIWQRFRKTSSPVDKVEEVSEPLLTGELTHGQTLRHPSFGKKHEVRSEDGPLVSSYVCIDPEDHALPESVKAFPQCSALTLEVISGPSLGRRLSKHATHNSDLSVRIGRVMQNDLVLNDPEVSGKHALVYWNSKEYQWELVDTGSLNGTFLNSKLISNPDATQRQRSIPIILSNGDVITLGSSSQIFVQISEQDVSNATNFSTYPISIGIGIASDPMSIRKGGKELPMEDAFYYELPLRRTQQFGVFCVFDGHGGPEAAKSACKIMPEKLACVLLQPGRMESVIYSCDAADVLRDAFRETEAVLEYEYEGCTATVLLLWYDYKHTLFAQCANVGDSACIFNMGGKHVNMTEDHRLTSSPEKARMMGIGKTLRDGETRLCGMNIARVLGDKFLKEQDVRFSADPYISGVLQITTNVNALAMIASDGLWDVLSPTRAMQIALKAREGEPMAEEAHVSCAQRIANLIVKEARKLRTKDNTTVIILDFTNINGYCKIPENRRFDTISIHT
eukprot:TRINITY_DN10203_c0_g1_i1.p1 TRINITY_DN10203_c0_g1~~TRINITY_DN10203_c0_g1_i1.p1  ORF type:complete len:540 (+),score=106.85 TRINITY_DN10203_c0_g1_i1:254-1873(+)